MRSFKVSFTPSIYYFYLFSYYLCVVVILLSSQARFKWIAFLCASLICIAIFFILLCQNFRFKQAKKFRYRKIQTHYPRCVALGSCSALLFTLSVIAFTFSQQLAFPATLYIASLIALFFSVRLFLAESDHFEKYYQGGIAWLIRLAWIAVTFYCYSLARHTFMTLADLTYEQTATRLTVIGYAGLLTALFISASLVTVFWILLLFENASVVCGNKPLIMKRNALPVVIPVIATAVITWNIFSTNTSPVLNFTFSVIVPLETRDTFICHKQQRYIPDAVARYYLEAGENSWRVFERQNNGWEVRRLECQHKAPGYRLSEIKNREELVSEKLQALGENARAMQRALLPSP
ncbi:hypothetical protein BBB56_02445 [Candidatus Pantoea deserta]|uniref:Uncharacterized protein n=1 Tax=Candidatus Pantoea deserta TaxID=1869313 RepID=A0A3N4P7S3_9GAMM|nr:hypothetical protein [Pantoea deserta]RPE04713.1 hypothetical protein BBB56_02445 [Pantoea deserta]